MLLKVQLLSEGTVCILYHVEHSQVLFLDRLLMFQLAEAFSKLRFFLLVPVKRSLVTLPEATPIYLSPRRLMLFKTSRGLLACKLNMAWIHLYVYALSTIDCLCTVAFRRFTLPV